MDGGGREVNKLGGGRDTEEGMGMMKRREGEFQRQQVNVISYQR